MEQLYHKPCQTMCIALLDGNEIKILIGIVFCSLTKIIDLQLFSFHQSNFSNNLPDEP